MTAPLEAKLAELKGAFDRAFAAPRPEPAGDRVALLRIRVAGEPFVLRVDRLAGMQAGLRIVPLPGSDSAFRGLVALRGQIVPAFDLAALLGEAAGGPPRWVALVAGAALALGFDELDGLLEVPLDALPVTAGRPGDFAPGRVEETGRLIDVPAITEHLLTRAPEKPGRI